MRVLLTGFEPFDGGTVNPSWEVASALARSRGGEVSALRLPVSFARSLGVLYAELERLRPQAVISFGLASSRSALTPERVALNLDEARIPDNDGSQPSDIPVVPGAPAAYFGTLSALLWARALEKEGVPAQVSYSAGTYVCNHVFFGLLHWQASRGGVGGFCHLPPFETVSFERQTAALDAFLGDVLAQKFKI
ncbi:pyroglutamyl-peptidase I family protein [Jonquetella sp. BV3C21]|uniref:pyroglutamyl-peptidase I family protein n=1 Tax=Jonquetella sp. BV3C21 TaxID=1111126 RepID=UPI0003AE0778|nr:pyroglutamyl-peptidase I [Jonquetella sp. BV3C21]ERL24075.1 putative pyroglutamyl-peptidase I [Jonquetella sp. BV3C21]